MRTRCTRTRPGSRRPCGCFVSQRPNLPQSILGAGPISAYLVSDPDYYLDDKLVDAEGNEVDLGVAVSHQSVKHTVGLSANTWDVVREPDVRVGGKRSPFFERLCEVLRK